MLIPKPYLLRKRHQKRQEQLANYGRVSPQDEDHGDEEAGNLRLAAAHHDEEEEFDFGEIAVHQVRVIGTIDFKSSAAIIPYSAASTFLGQSGPLHKASCTFLP